MTIEAALAENTAAINALVDVLRTNIETIKADGALRSEIRDKIESAAKTTTTVKKTEQKAAEPAEQKTTETKTEETPSADDLAGALKAAQETVSAFLDMAGESKDERKARIAHVKEKLAKLGAPKVSEIKSADDANRLAKAIEKSKTTFVFEASSDDDL